MKDITQYQSVKYMKETLLMLLILKCRLMLGSEVGIEPKGEHTKILLF